MKFFKEFRPKNQSKKVTKIDSFLERIIHDAQVCGKKWSPVSFFETVQRFWGYDVFEYFGPRAFIYVLVIIRISAHNY